MEDTTPTDAETEAQADAAQRELEQLTAEAENLQNEADAAIAAFKSTPSAKTLTAKEVAAQLAVNARDAIGAYNEETQAVRNAAQRIRDMRELEQLRIAMDFEALTSTKLGQLTARYLADVQDELAQLGERIVLYNGSYRRWNALESHLGDGLQRDKTDIGTALRHVTELLQPTFGESMSRLAIFKYFEGGHGLSRFEINLRFPPEELSKGGE